MTDKDMRCLRCWPIEPRSIDIQAEFDKLMSQTHAELIAILDERREHGECPNPIAEDTDGLRDSVKLAMMGIRVEYVEG